MEVSAHFDAPAPLLPELIALHARWLGGKPALVTHRPEGEWTLSWRELDSIANRIAQALIADGVTPGDAVALAMDNRWEAAAALIGIIKAGAVATPINLTISTEAIIAMLADCDAGTILASADQAQRLAPHISISKRVVAGGEFPGWRPFHEWLSEQPADPPGVTVRDDDPINVIYSSGTTGRPKGIVHSHRRRLDWAMDLGLTLRYHSGAQTLCTLPLYSNISWVMMLCTLCAGGTLHVTDRFDAGRFLELVSTRQITHSALVPVQLQRIVDHPAFTNTDFGNLQGIMSCGSPLWPELKRTILDTFPCGIIELYGLTEGVITTLNPEDAAGREASVGKPLTGTDLRIVDDSGHELPPGQPGEIVSRGRILMSGYLNRDDASREATWSDAEGRRWLRTGDLGKLDDDGFLYIVGRKKDMILSGGQNIYPADIEAVLIGHPDVNDAAVIGVPHEQWGETPLAVVEPAPGHTPDTDSLMHWANERLGRFQRISSVVVTESLPRNPNGKVQKTALRTRYGSGN